MATAMTANPTNPAFTDRPPIPRPQPQLQLPPPPTCAICLTTLPRNPKTHVRFPCSHTHCIACLRRNFDLSVPPTPSSPTTPRPSLSPRTTITTTPFRPVQCCPNQRLPIPDLRRALGLDSAQTNAYRALLAEHDAANAGRALYCHDAARCGQYIPQALRGASTGRCRACWKRTCVRCGGKGPHEGPSGGGGGGGGCPAEAGKASVGRRRRTAEEQEEEERAAVEEFRKLVREKRWQKCPKCKRWVEKTEGCNHIRCLCGCDFCYRCGRAPFWDHTCVV